MHLRRLFYCKLGQLSCDRKQLLHQMSADSPGLGSSASHVADRKHLTNQLAVLDEDAQQAYMQLASTYFRGVSTCLFFKVVPTCLIIEEDEKMCPQL